MRHQRFLARLPHCASPRIDLHGKARTTVGVCSWRVLSASRTRPISAVRHAKQRAHGERDERQSPTALSTSTSPVMCRTVWSTTRVVRISRCGCSRRRLRRALLRPGRARRRRVRRARGLRRRRRRPRRVLRRRLMCRALRRPWQAAKRFRAVWGPQWFLVVSVLRWSRGARVRRCRRVVLGRRSRRLRVLRPQVGWLLRVLRLRLLRRRRLRCRRRLRVARALRCRMVRVVRLWCRRRRWLPPPSRVVALC